MIAPSIAVAIVVGASLAADDSRATSAAEQAVLSAPNSLACGGAYERYFKLLGLPRVVALKQSDHPGIALQAAWEEARVVVRRPGIGANAPEHRRFMIQP